MKKLVYILLAVLLCMNFVLSACGEKGGGNNSNKNDHEYDIYYTVTFDSQGGSAVDSQRVLAGNPATVPTSPTKSNCEFNGWYRSSSDAVQWNFATDRVNENITLYAHWTEKQDTLVPSEMLTFEKSVEGFIVTGDSGQLASIVIPAEHDGVPVVGIADSAFAYSKHMSEILSVTIPDSVTEIGKNAFHNQSALVSVDIGTNSKLEKIGNNAFSGNSALKSIYLPAGLNSLGDDVFNNCGGLKTITVAAENTRYSGEGNCLIDNSTHTLIRGSNTSVIPETVTKIGVAAFRRATLTVLTIPTSVTSIEKYAISDSAITKINYNGTSAEWETLMAASSKYWDMGKETVEVVFSDTTRTSHILVAYFSCTGNTEKIAGYIAEFTGGTLYQITPAEPYTNADLNYNDSSSRTTKEQNDDSARPAISGNVKNMADYEVIFLGYPIWWEEAPKIIYTFLESYDFSGKTIIPFCTSASSPIGSSANNLHSLTSGAIWQSGMHFSGNSTQGNVQSWLNGLEY